MDLVLLDLVNLKSRMEKVEEKLADAFSVIEMLQGRMASMSIQLSKTQARIGMGGPIKLDDEKESEEVHFFECDSCGVVVDARKCLGRTAPQGWSVKIVDGSTQHTCEVCRANARYFECDVCGKVVHSTNGKLPDGWQCLVINGAKVYVCCNNEALGLKSGASGENPMAEKPQDEKEP